MNDKNNKNDKPEIQEKPPGALLQQARKSRGFTVEHISSRLRLSMKVINALENDSYEELPAPIFVRGYIRSYAALVGLDANKISESYSQLVQSTDASISLDAAHLGPISRNSSSDKRSWFLPLVSIALVICLGVIIWFSQSSETEQTDNEEPVANENMSSTFLNPSIEPMQSDVAEPGQPSLAAVAAPEVETPPTSGSNIDTVTAEAQVADSAEEMPQAPERIQPAQVEPQAQANDSQELDQLKLEFNADSWVDVRDALGQRLIYRMVKSGDRLAVSGKPPFKLTLGNAPEIILMRNGAKVDLSPYTRGKVAKFRLGEINE